MMTDHSRNKNLRKSIIDNKNTKNRFLSGFVFHFMFSRERRWEVGERGTGVGREGGRRWERVPPQ
jgi:hypothetical protein